MRVYNPHCIDEKTEAWFVCHMYPSHMVSTGVNFINSSVSTPPLSSSSAMALFQRAHSESLMPSTSFRGIKGTDQGREPPGRKAWYSVGME